MIKNKKMLVAGMMLGLTAAGGFINEYFSRSGQVSPADHPGLFRIIVYGGLILSLLTFPWWQRPRGKSRRAELRDLVGVHTVAWSIIVLCGGMSFFLWYSAPGKNVYYFFATLVYVNVGVYLLIKKPGHVDF